MSNTEYTFMSPNFVLTNRKTGKPFFEMKRKTPTDDECYYLFKFYEENMSEEDRKKIHKLFEEYICPMAATMNIGMFSFDELSERATERMKEIVQSGRQLSEEQIDVTIEVFDYATKTLGSLVVGIGTMPKESEQP